MSKLNLLQIIQSVFAALIGVQKGQKLQQDIDQGSGWVFVIAGLIGTLLFIAVLVTIVSNVVK